MLPILPLQTGSICLRCQWRLLNQRPGQRRLQYLAQLVSARHLEPRRRALHATANRPQEVDLADSSPQTFDPALIPRPTNVPFRQHLQKWEEQYGGPSPEALVAFQHHPLHGEISNHVAKLNSVRHSDEPVNDYEEEDDGGEELITIGLFLKPGDVVEVNPPGRETILAVFVRQIDRMSQFLTANGTWAHVRLTNISFAIQGAINPALLQPVIPYLPTDPDKVDPKGGLQLPREATAPVAAMLEQIMDEAEVIYRTNASTLDAAYDVLADSSRTRMMTVAQIAKTLLARNDPTWTPSAAALVAVRKALNHNMYRFRTDDRSQRLTNIFSIRPKQEVANVEVVHGWIREYQDYLANAVGNSKDSMKTPSKGAASVANFIHKARKLVAMSRKNREPTRGLVGPIMTTRPKSGDGSLFSMVWSDSFTSTDQQIINFLQSWVLASQFTHMPSLHAACAFLLQAMGCYSKSTLKKGGVYHEHDAKRDLGRSQGLLLLQEIGVLTPWENRYIYDELLMLPALRLSRNLEVLQAKVEALEKRPNFQDAMSDLRRDWGSTAVYCIDDAGALEIDDGISVEKIDGADAGFWIHVHVANPTAFFDKTHPLAGLAAHMTETVYTPERPYMMLPSWVTQGYFSLGKDRPVITFSTRISTQGDVLETKIQNGIIRKIVSLMPSELSSLLGEEASNVEVTRLVVGGKLPASPMKRPMPTISSDELQDLQDLYAATRVLHKKRSAVGGIQFTRPNTYVRVYENVNRPGLAWTPPSVDRSRTFDGDPIIELTTTPSSRVSFDCSTFDSKHIVEEAMLLAGSTAATWCTDRHIPVMYRGTIQQEALVGDLTPDEIKEQTLSCIQKHGFLPASQRDRYIKSLGRAIAHTSPIPHNIIGVPGYVKVTSPLRRFSDMIAHWQIEAALREEARTGQKLDAKDGTDVAHRRILPFSQRQMQESIITLSPREQMITQTKAKSLRHWSIMALSRAAQYEQQSLPGHWKLVVMNTNESVIRFNGVVGNLMKFNIRACMMNRGGTDAQVGEARVGDIWEVKLDSVDLYLGDVYVEPVRLLHREPEIA